MDVFLPMNETNEDYIDYPVHRAFVYQDKQRFFVVLIQILVLQPNE